MTKWLDRRRASGALQASPIWLLFLVHFLVVASQAEVAKDDFKLYGDLRLRLEADWNSQTSDGRERDDRVRARIRARVGLDFSPNDRLTFGVRLRSGSDESQQSPHVTVVDFDGEGSENTDLDLDRWFLKVDGKKAWGWIGRNRLPLLQENEFVWDADVTPVGLLLGYKTEAGPGGQLELHAGYFSLPVGMREFAGHLALVQAAYGGESWTAAGALLDFDADPEDDDAARLLSGNGLRDYSVLVGSLQGRFSLGGRRLTLAGDIVVNTEDYSGAPDPFTAAHRDESDGFVAMVRYGETREPGDWLAAWYYARIETLAVNASYAQDDWTRWGSATETRSSNFMGHEWRFVYMVGKERSLVARLYLAESVTTGEDGNRFRMDFNWRF